VNNTLVKNWRRKKEGGGLRREGKGEKKGTITYLPRPIIKLFVRSSRCCGGGELGGKGKRRKDILDGRHT